MTPEEAAIELCPSKSSHRSGQCCVLCKPLARIIKAALDLAEEVRADANEALP